jgi:hypothetical protein
MPKQMPLQNLLSLTNLVWVLLCLLPMLHVWTVPNLSTKVVLAVFYIGDAYRDDSGVTFLEKSGIKITQVNNIDV